MGELMLVGIIMLLLVLSVEWTLKKMKKTEEPIPLNTPQETPIDEDPVVGRVETVVLKEKES